MPNLIIARAYHFDTWYWLADDGRVYSSASNSVVTTDDAGYVNFLREGPATQWPRDESGDQTNESINEVLTAKGLPNLS